MGVCKSAVNTTRRFVFNMPDYVIAKLDFNTHLIVSVETQCFLLKVKIFLTINNSALSLMTGQSILISLFHIFIARRRSTR